MADIRASNADRDRTVARLRAGHADGCLEDEELEDRIEIALGARTRSALALLTSDLPAAGPVAWAAAPVAVGGWGRRSFRQEHLLASSVTTTWRAVLSDIVPAMSAYGYAIDTVRERELVVFRLEERSTLMALVSPLAALLDRDRTQVALSLTAEGDHHTRVVVTGVARRSVRKAFAQIST